MEAPFRKSDLRQLVLLRKGFWIWSTYWLAGNKEPLTSGKWNVRNHWHAVALKFISAELGQDTDGRSCAVPPGFDRYGENSNYKGLRIG